VTLHLLIQSVDTAGRHARRRLFAGNPNAIEPRANFGQRLSKSLQMREIANRIDDARLVKKKEAYVYAPSIVAGGHVGWYGGAGVAIDVFTFDCEPLAARRYDSDVGACAKNCHSIGCSVDDVLAVIDNESKAAAATCGCR